MNIFTILIEQPIINILVAIYQGLISINVPFAFGFAIIALSAVIRIAIAPFMAAQLKHTKRMQDMAPHIAKIKEKHKGDIMKQNEAQAALMKEHGVNPFAGCLPVLIQFPIIIGLFFALQKISKITTIAEINKFVYVDGLKLTQMWDTNFFGLPVNKAPKEIWATAAVVAIGVAVITGLLQLIQSIMMQPATSKMPAVTEKPKDSAPDMSTMLQKQMLVLVPVLFAWSSFTLPIGLSLYWNTFSLFGIIQQYQVAGLGGLARWLGRSK
jgi:YidC/Oxa1 family membrane protein insertase